MKKGFKFNLIDLLVVIVIIGVLAFVGTKLVKVGGEGFVTLNNYEYSFFCEEVPDFVIDYIKEEAEVTSADNNDFFGKIKSITVGDSISYAANSDGQMVQSSKPNHKSVEIVVSGTGEQTGAGVKLTKGVYGVGHSITLKAGNAKVFGKISGIKKLD